MKTSDSLKQLKSNVKNARKRIQISRILIAAIVIANIALIIFMIYGNPKGPASLPGLNLSGVVKIETPNGVGSGVVVDIDRVLTAAHVAGDVGNTVNILFKDGTSQQASVVASGYSQWQSYLTGPGQVQEGATRYDWALLQLSSQVDVGLIMLLGDSDAAQEMDEVIVIGYPGGGDHNVSKGIISGKDPGEIRTDAPIDPGNSGGPMVAVEDKNIIGVIGIMVSVPNIGGQMAQSVHKAVPIQIVKEECRNAGYELF